MWKYVRGTNKIKIHPIGMATLKNLLYLQKTFIDRVQLLQTSCRLGQIVHASDCAQLLWFLMNQEKKTIKVFKC